MYCLLLLYLFLSADFSELEGDILNYDELIYTLLDQYLPGIASSLSSIDSSVQSVLSYLPDLSDIRKFLLWFLVFYISTKLVRWSYRI